MPTKADIVSSFIGDAPPGQLQNVLDDIKALTSDEPQLAKNLDPAFEKYNEEQFATVKVPGSNELVIISRHNALGGNRYFDPLSSSSFALNHSSQTASDSQSHTSQSPHSSLATSLHKALSLHASEHYPSSTLSVIPTDESVAILLVANKYSLSNYWSGRWRTEYILSPSSGKLTGTIKVDVHYFEDGNVRMQSEKKVDLQTGTAAEEVRKSIAQFERKYEEELIRGFSRLNEGVFKTLRRQLPVTRQKVEWDKVGAYRLGQDIGGGRSR